MFSSILIIYPSLITVTLTVCSVAVTSSTTTYYSINSSSTTTSLLIPTVSYLIVISSPCLVHLSSSSSTACSHSILKVTYSLSSSFYSFDTSPSSTSSPSLYSSPSLSSPSPHTPSTSSTSIYLLSISHSILMITSHLMNLTAISMYSICTHIF